MNATELDILRELVSGQAVDLLNANADGVGEELVNNPEGKLSVSMSFKLTLVGRKLFCDGSLAYSRKFSDDAEGTVELPDPKQPTLELGKEATT